MKKLLLIILLAFGASTFFTPAIRAEVATKGEALALAKNWIRLILYREGDWGGSQAPEIREIVEFKRGERILGYFMPVKPQGFIVVSHVKQLASVKAYSAVSNLDPSSDEGLADIIKGGMERSLNSIEKRVGPIGSAKNDEIDKVIEIDYRLSWEELEGDVTKLDYQQGGILLSSEWHQWDPYYRQCPAGSNGCTETHCTVGCVATAGAQIMRYWAWPPYGIDSPYDDDYDWPNMPDMVWSSSPAIQIDAVAELCHEIGLAASTHYCMRSDKPCASGSNDGSMIHAYESHYRYSPNCTIRYRSDYSAANWFDLIKVEINRNRPMQYAIPDHNIVCDGWREIGSPIIRQYHINYGVEGGWYSAWYTLDAIQGGDPNKEDLIEDIYPAQSIFAANGSYPRESFPYRYFPQDAVGGVSGATFEPGQFIQFLPGTELTCGTGSGSIRFLGTPGLETRLFAAGEVSRGIRIDNGALKLYGHNGGGIKLH
jgi:hypothetical protein